MRARRNHPSPSLSRRRALADREVPGRSRRRRATWWFRARAALFLVGVRPGVSRAVFQRERRGVFGARKSPPRGCDVLRERVTARIASLRARRERNGAEPGGAPPPAVPSTNRPTSRTSPPSLAYIAAIARSRATDGNPVPRTRHVFGADPNCDVSTTRSATAVRSVVGANRIVTITSPFAGTTPRLGSTVNGPEVAFRVA